MAITDVPEFAHLTDSDIEALAIELGAIRQDIEDSRGERDARYEQGTRVRLACSRVPAPVPRFVRDSVPVSARI